MDYFPIRCGGGWSFVDSGPSCNHSNHRACGVVTLTTITLEIISTTTTTSCSLIRVGIVRFLIFSSLVVRSRILASFGSTFEYSSQASILLYFERATVQSFPKVIFLFKLVCESISSLIRSMNALNLAFGPDKSALSQYRQID